MTTEIDNQRSYAKWRREEDARWEKQKAWARWYAEARAAYEIEQRKRGRDIDWRDDWYDKQRSKQSEVET